MIQDINESQISENNTTEFVLMYLTPPNENNSSERDCLVFSYPEQNSESSKNPILLKLKGMFITMSHVVGQITNQLPILSNICITQDSQEKVFKVAFFHEYSSMLALALPSDKFSSFEVRIIIETIARMICFLYNSLDSAFKNNCNHKDLKKTCKIMNYLLKQNKQNCDINLNFFINAIPKLIVDDDLILRINDFINEYEAMDWLSDDDNDDYNENIDDPIQEFIVIGSCLIYKSNLIISHLPANYLVDVIGFVRLSGLLQMNSIKLVMWKEVHPASLRTNEMNDFVMNQGNKYFLVIVGIESLFHCVLVEMPFLSKETSLIKPNEAIINESIKLLVLILIKSGIKDEFDQFLNSKSQLTNSESKLEKKKYKSLSSLKELIPNVFSSSTKQQSFHSTGSLLSLDESSSISGSHISHSSPSLQQSLLSYTSSSATSLCQSVSGANSTFNCKLFLQNKNLPDNLVCYTFVEKGFQIISCPIILCIDEIRNQLFNQFLSCCFAISNQLHNNENDENEIGVTFELKVNLDSKIKRSIESLMFFVIGHLDLKGNEFYGCFQIKNSSNLDIDIKDVIYNLKISQRLV